jgi:hypothetical protein
VITHDADGEGDEESWQTHHEENESTDVGFGTETKCKPHEGETLCALHQDEDETVQPQQSEWLDTQ